DYNANDPQYHVSPMKFERVDDGLAYDYWIGAIPHNEAPYQYHFTIKNNVDSIYFNVDGIGEGEPATSAADWSVRPGFFTPSWSQGALWYSIMPESYYNANTLNDKTGAQWDTVWGGHNSWAGEWFGGDLSGIQAKEDYLYNTLNVTSLFLNPIWVTAHNAGYGSYDFFQIDSSFGNDNDLLSLVGALHEDELKIMLDAVFEYCNVNNILNNISKLYPDLLGDLYYGFGQRDPNGNQIDSNWGGVLIDFSHLIARETLYTEEESVMLAYLIYFGIDAWRMDVGNTLSGSDPNNWGNATQILADIRKYVKAVSEEVLFLTEHADSNQLTDGIMDSKWNYAFNKAVLDWCQNNSNAKMLSTNLKNAMLYYPRGVTNSLYNFLTTHDQSYFYQEIDYDKPSYLSAEILLLTYLGSPCIYFGEEYGQKPHYYTDAKTMQNSFYTAMSWDEWNYDYEIYNLVRNLTCLRKDYKEVFATGGLMNLYAESKGNENDIYAYARFKDEVAITVLNRRGSFVEDFQLDVARLGLKEGTILYDYLTNREYMVHEGTITLDIASYGSVLVSKNSKRFVSDLEYEWKEESTSISKVGEHTYSLRGESVQNEANYAYANGFNNYAMDIVSKKNSGDVDALIKDEVGDELCFGARLSKNQLTPIWKFGGSANEGQPVSFTKDDVIRIAREKNNLCKVYLNDREVASATIPFTHRIRLGVSNLSGTNELSLEFLSLEKQIGSDFSTGVLGSWITPKNPVSFKEGNLVVNDNFLSAPVDMGDATFQAELSLPSTLSNDELAGIYFGAGEDDYMFLGAQNDQLTFGHVIHGKLAQYGKSSLEKTNVKLQIEKSGTTYQGVLLTAEGRTIIGQAFANYSRLTAGLLNESKQNMLVSKAGFG
ncbi:MAG: hypothetical protein J5736_05415, partial [Bacilli bacterium]|nr:hypothetical protein [Bacilli bacterium]